MSTANCTLRVLFAHKKGMLNTSIIIFSVPVPFALCLVWSAYLWRRKHGVCGKQSHC